MLYRSKGHLNLPPSLELEGVPVEKEWVMEHGQLLAGLPEQLGLVPYLLAR